MIEVLLLAIALSMDAFAVAIGLGSKEGLGSKTGLGSKAGLGPSANPTPKHSQGLKNEPQLRDLALKSACYFGVFQGLMPLVGYLAGHSVLGWVNTYADWIAFGLLLLIGAKMVFESFSEGIEEDIRQVSHRVLLTLAIATSVDALAAGFSLTLLPVNPLLACAIIGVTTFGFSWLGVYVGNHASRKSGTKLESRAELAGGVVLILIGFKFVLV